MKLVLKNCFVEVDGVDLTCHVRSVEISAVKNAVESDTMCGHDQTHGIEQSTFTINWAQSFDVGTVNATFWPLWRDEEEFPVVIRPVEKLPVSATNPEFSGNCKLFEYTPLSGSVGDLVESSTALPVIGEVEMDDGTTGGT